MLINCFFIFRKLLYLTFYKLYLLLQLSLIPLRSWISKSHLIRLHAFSTSINRKFYFLSVYLFFSPCILISSVDSLVPFPSAKLNCYSPVFFFYKILSSLPIKLFYLQILLSILCCILYEVLGIGAKQNFNTKSDSNIISPDIITVFTISCIKKFP